MGPLDLKKDRYLMLKEWEKENIRIYIHASSAASSASSVASASASLEWGFYGWSGTTWRLRKTNVQIIFICKPCFSTYPSTTNHDVWSTTIILGISVLYMFFSSRVAKTHFICGSLLLSWCFSFCNVFRSRFLAIEPTAPMSSSASWASMS